MSICEIAPLRPANPTSLEKAIYAAQDEWFLADRARDNAASSESAAKLYLAKRDEHRRECGRQLTLAKKLHAASGIETPWKEWAPLKTGWSYRTITRRMKDFAEPDAPKQRDQARARRERVTTNTDVVTSSADARTAAARLPGTCGAHPPALEPAAVSRELWEYQADAIKALAPDQFTKLKAWFLSYIGGK